MNTNREIEREAYEDAVDERRRERRHWCDECRGHTGSGSPCADDSDDEGDEE